MSDKDRDNKKAFVPSKAMLKNLDLLMNLDVVEDAENWDLYDNVDSNELISADVELGGEDE